MIFELVGDGTDKPRLIERCRTEGIGSIQFSDPVPKKEIYALLRRADACVLTFKAADVLAYGASPNKLYDYFAVARPVVFATAMIDSPVEQAKAGYTVPAEDPRALAEAIARLARMTPEMRAEYGMAGRLFAESRHDFDALAAKLGQALATLTGTRWSDEPS